MTKNDAKRCILFNKPIYTLFHSEEYGYRLDIVMDLFNDHMEYQINKATDNIIYFSTFDIDEAIDKYFEIIEGAKRNG
jgi:hypothetical protein